jgi:hypothetical protein
VIKQLVHYGFPHGRVADYGAGTSPVPIALARIGYETVVVDPDAVTLLGRKVGNEWDLADYSRWSIPLHRAGIEDRVFDDRELVGAVSVSVLEHLLADQRRQGLVRVADAMTSGGVFVCTIDLMPDGTFLWNRVEHEIEPAAVHGTLVHFIDEALASGFRLLECARCPIRPREPVVGLAFVRE